MGDQERIEELERRIAQLEHRGEATVKPLGRDWSVLDRTVSASMPPSALQALVEGASPRVMADLRSDRAQRGGFGPREAAEQKLVPSERGWVEPAKLTSPPGQDRIKAIADTLEPHSLGNPLREEKKAAE